MPIELANTEHIKMIFFRARESANVGPVARMYLARKDSRAPGKTVVYHADNLSK